MRALLSYVAGLLTLVMLLASGGAWSSTERPELVPVDIPPHAAVFPNLGSLPSAPTVTVAPLPPGCRPPLIGATCPPTVVAGALDVPMTIRDLVPQDVTSVEDWRPIVAEFFRPADVSRALRILRCESRGDPRAKNPVSTASGLFQHLGSAWTHRSARAGWEGADIFDPVANAAVAAWLVYEGGGWSHWNASRHCWG